MNPSILIVEDEEALTLLLRYNLEAAGYDVESVARGDEADLRLREAVPDLVILDWMLPGVSGIELCRRLRSRRRGCARLRRHCDRPREEAGHARGPPDRSRAD